MPITGSPYEKDWRNEKAGGTRLNDVALEDIDLRNSMYTDAALAAQSASLTAAIAAVEAQASGIPTVKSFGAIGDGSADDTAAILAMAAVAPDANVILAPGKYRCTDELVMDVNGIYGIGDVSLQFPADIGAGKYGVRWTGSGPGCKLVNVKVLGPGWVGTSLNPSLTPGVAPSLMRGVLVPAGGQVIDGRSHGFNTGYEFRESNEWFINVITGGNLVGIRAAPGATAGDQIFVNVKGDRDFLALYHIDVGATIGGARFSTGFAGNVPYGFYAPAGGSAQALLGCQLLDFGFEGYGNGMMYAGGNRGILGVSLVRCGEGSGFLGPSIAGNPKEAAIDAGSLNLVIDNGFPTAVGTNAIIQARVSGTLTWNELDNPLLAANTAGKPAFLTPEPADGTFGSMQTAPRIEFCRSIPSNAVAPNEVVETFSNGVKRASNGIPRGVALAADYANGPIPVVQSGIVPVKSTDTGFNGVHRYAKVDPANPGTVISTTTSTDVGIVGVNVQGLSGGMVKVKLRGLA